jgi:hypothetical protein
MRFAISMTDIEGAWDGLPPERQEEILAQHRALKAELRAAGSFVDALHFHPRSEARTVRMDSNGSINENNGPYDTDASEYIGGVYVIDCDSMDEAVAWARKARFMVGANEVRQIWGE